MKIVYLINAATIHSGSNKSFLALLEVIGKTNEPVVIVPEQGDIVELLRQRGIMVHVCPFCYWIRPPHKTITDKILFVPRLIRMFIKDTLAVKRISHIVKDFKPDIIHTNTSVTQVGYIVAKKYGIPHVTHIREYGDKDFNMKIYGLEKRIKSSDAYSICITQDIARHHNLQNNPLSTVIYNPIVTIPSIFIYPKKDYFFYAGRIEEAKGVYELIQGYIRYSKEIDNPLPIKIAGSWQEGRQTDYKEKIEKLIEESGINHLVEWLGQRSDVGELMKYAKATIVPSLNEAFGRVMPEAMAYGSLVIGRDTSGTKEQFDNGKIITGSEIGLRFRSEAELAACLRSAAEMDSNTYASYVKRSQHVIKSLYTDIASAKKVSDFYDFIIKDFSKA